MEEENRIEKIPVYVVDIDGTLALKRAGDENCRNIYDWKRVSEDVGYSAVIKTYIALNAFYRCIVVSGRSEECREETLDWLRRHHINTQEKHGFRLFMRKYKDYRPDWVVKEEIYHELIEPEFDVIAAFDDRTQIVKLWRDVLGIPCFQVDWGFF
jgi:hypothetical protein